MFPFLVGMYVRLGLREEAEARQTFGLLYDQYAAVVPRWLPDWRPAPPGKPAA